MRLASMLQSKMEWTFLVVKKKFLEFLTVAPDAKIPSKRALNIRLIFGTV